MGWDKRDKGKLQVKGKQNRDHTGAMANLVRVLLLVTEHGPLWLISFMRNASTWTCRPDTWLCPSRHRLREIFADLSPVQRKSSSGNQEILFITQGHFAFVAWPRSHLCVPNLIPSEHDSQSSASSLISCPQLQAISHNHFTFHMQPYLPLPLVGRYHVFPQADLIRIQSPSRPARLFFKPNSIMLAE